MYSYLREYMCVIGYCVVSKYIKNCLYLWFIENIEKEGALQPISKNLSSLCMYVRQIMHIWKGIDDSPTIFVRILYKSKLLLAVFIRQNLRICKECVGQAKENPFLKFILWNENVSMLKIHKWLHIFLTT